MASDIYYKYSKRPCNYYRMGSLPNFFSWGLEMDENRACKTMLEVSGKDPMVRSSSNVLETSGWDMGSERTCLHSIIFEGWFLTLDIAMKKHFFTLSPSVLWLATTCILQFKIESGRFEDQFISTELITSYSRRTEMGTAAKAMIDGIHQNIMLWWVRSLILIYARYIPALIFLISLLSRLDVWKDTFQENCLIIATKPAFSKFTNTQISTQNTGELRRSHSTSWLPFLQENPSFPSSNDNVQYKLILNSERTRNTLLEIYRPDKPPPVASGARFAEDVPGDTHSIFYAGCFKNG